MMKNAIKKRQNFCRRNNENRKLKLNKTDEQKNSSWFKNPYSDRNNAKRKNRIKRIVKDKSKSFYDFVNKIAPKKSIDEKNVAIQI